MYAPADVRATRSPTDSAVAAALPEVPGAFTRKLLVFEFVALVEYWLAPLFVGITNYAGIWSTVGYLLFAALGATLAAGVFRPLVPHLRLAFERPFRRLAFHGLWVSGLIASLLATNTVQVGLAATPGPASVEATTVYTPFGAWPGVGFTLPQLHLLGTLNVEIVAVLGILAVLWASAIVLTFGKPAPSCPVPREEAGPWRHRLTAAAFWGPLGFMTGCSYCTPIYVAALAVVAPGAAIGTYNAIPLVPWIGLSGLLGLVSLALTLRLLNGATRPERPAPGETERPRDVEP